ncbi:hypothetical protein Ahy_B01g051619 isoform C [Arachis hypogaea]|uniref:Cytochrome P450 n=1 Tax=Arachis hypogaea TaxID=3818 RepID=A0A445AMN2_ARAHY|nr:hypothetical protein Ahy_B01g051619 isoform C [Arachis hypogaea]
MEYSAPTFLLLLFFIIPLFINLLKHNDSTKKSKKPRLPPGPKPWPIVGNIPEMLANKPTFRWIQNIMNDLETEIACIRLGNIHVILVTSPSIAREFFMKQDAIFASRPLNWSSKYVSSGYLTTTITPFGEQWKKMKRVMVEELISPKRHQWLHDKRVEEADNLVRHVYNQTNKNGGGLVDLRIVTKQYGGNLMRRLLFNKRYFGNGREDGGAGAEEVEYVESLFIAIRHIYAFSVSDYLPWLWWLDFEGHKKVLKEVTNTIRKYHDPIIEERIHQWRNGTRAHQEDWLDVLISLKDANSNPFLTLQEIKSQIMTPDLPLSQSGRFKSDPKWNGYQTGRGVEQGGIGYRPAVNPPLNQIQVSNEVNEPSQAPLAVPHCHRCSVAHLAIQLTKHTAAVAHQPSSPRSVAHLADVPHRARIAPTSLVAVSLLAASPLRSAVSGRCSPCRPSFLPHRLTAAVLCLLSN